MRRLQTMISALLLTVAIPAVADHHEAVTPEIANHGAVMVKQLTITRPLRHYTITWNPVALQYELRGTRPGRTESSRVIDVSQMLDEAYRDAIVEATTIADE